MSPVFADLQTPSICLFWNDEWTIWQIQWYSHNTSVIPQCKWHHISGIPISFKRRDREEEEEEEESQKILERAVIQRGCLLVKHGVCRAQPWMREEERERGGEFCRTSPKVCSVRVKSRSSVAGWKAAGRDRVGRTGWWFAWNYKALHFDSLAVQVVLPARG